MNIELACRRLAWALAFTVAASAACAQAREDTANAGDLLRDIAAWERVREQRGSPEDLVRAGFLLGYLEGMLHVHAQNTELWRTIADRPAGQEPALSDETVRVALVFAPLEGVSDRLQVERALALLKDYLQRHPQQGKAPWHLLVQNALFDRGR